MVDDPDELDDIKEGDSPPLLNPSLNGGKSSSQVPGGISDMKPLNINIPQMHSSYSSINPAAQQPLKLIPNHHNHSPPSPTGTIRYGR